MKLNPQHQITVEEEQYNPNGPELAPVDTAVIGKPITIEKTKASGSGCCSHHK